MMEHRKALEQQIEQNKKKKIYEEEERRKVPVDNVVDQFTALGRVPNLSNQKHWLIL
jgi:hypothetical protein